MKNRVQNVYLSLGHILNNPQAFGLEERAPKALADALSAMQRDLFEELKDEMTDEELLAAELSQDADTRDFTALTPTSFAVREG